jgi:hypothetical protein
MLELQRVLRQGLYPCTPFSPVFGLLGEVDNEAAFASLGTLLPHYKTRRNHGTCASNLLCFFPGYLFVDTVLAPYLEILACKGEVLRALGNHSRCMARRERCRGFLHDTVLNGSEKVV